MAAKEAQKTQGRKREDEKTRKRANLLIHSFTNSLIH